MPSYQSRGLAPTINFPHNNPVKLLPKSIFKIALPALLLAAADQLLKLAAVAYLQTPVQFTPWLALRYEQNVGIAWSIFIPQPWLSIFNVFLLIVLPLYISQYIDLRRNSSRILLSMVIGGALGNLYDRLFRGFVIDFLAVGTFPVFNLADALLTVGIFLILVFYGRIKRTDTNKVSVAPP